MRTLPRLADILDGSYYGPGESLPTINRTMQFRLIARDGRGGLSYDTKNVTVAGSAGSFRVTAPTGVKSLPRASQQTVTWNVANTNAAPVSCPSVNVLLSTDGGATFTTLAANTPNDGSALVTLPDLPPTSLAFKVECANNIFFDISPNSLILCTSVSHDDHEAGFSGWTIWDSGYYTNPWQTRTDGGYSGNNYFYVEGTGHYFTDSYLESPTMTVVGASPALAFIHRYAMQMRDASYASDGGVVEVSVNGGAWADVGSARFIQGGYNTVITTSYQNVLKGRPAFSGDSLGYITSIVDLSGLAEAGDSVQVRFRQATDGWYWTAAWWGWAVDDVLLCRGDPIPLLSIEKTVALSNPKPLPGDSATYKIVVANQGGADAVGVRVTDTLPAYMNGTDLDQTVNVAANSRVTLTIPATIDAGAPDGALIQNTASFVHVSSTAYWPDSQRQGQASTRLIVNPEILYLPLVVRNK